MNSIERTLVLHHIAHYLFVQIEAELHLRRGETILAILQVRGDGVAYIEEGTGIGEVVLMDTEIAVLWEEVQRRQHPPAHS